MAVTNEQISAFLASNPGMSDTQIAEAMTLHGVTPAQMAAVTGLDVGAVQSRYDSALAAMGALPQASSAATTTSAGALTQAADNTASTSNNVLGGVILAGDSWLSDAANTRTIGSQIGQDVTNVAVGGSTTSDTLNQLNSFIGSGGTFAPGTTVMLDIGGNDLLQGVSADTVRDNLQQIVGTLGAQGVNVVLSGAPAVGSVADVTGSTNLAMSSIFNDVAANNQNVTLVDAMSGLLNQKNLVDDTGFHMNEAGRTAFNAALSNAYLQSLGRGPIDYSDQAIRDFVAANNLTADQAVALAPSFGLTGDRVLGALATATGATTTGTTSADAGLDTARGALDTAVGAGALTTATTGTGTNTWDYDKFYKGMSEGSTDTEYLSSLLDPLSTQNPDLANNAKNIFDEIINQQTVTGDAWASGKLGSKESAALDYALRLAEAGVTSLSDIKKENYIDVDGEGGEAVRTRLVNSKTGEVIGYDGAFTHSSGGGNRLGYALEVTDNGIVVPYTVPRRSGWMEFREGTLKPALSLMGPFIPGAGPFIAAGNAINAANKGDWGTAVVSALTAVPGFNSTLNFSPETLSSLNTAKTAGQVLNAIDKGNPVALANTLMQTDVGKDLMQQDMGGGISLGDVVNTAKIVQLANTGNYAEALASASELTKSPNLNLAASALNLAEAISTGDPFRVINSVGQLDRTIRSADQTVNQGNLTNRVYDDTIVQAGADAFIRAKQAGASDEDAMAASDAATGVIINAIPDAGPSNVVTTTYGQGGVDTNFGDLEGAIATNAINDAKRIENLDRISSLPRFADAYSQARALLGPNQTFTWNGKEYSTATAQERPDLSAPRVQAATDESAAETARLARQNAALVTGNAPDQSAAETARLKSMEKTGFFQSLYKDLNDRFRLQGEAANKYLRDNPDSPITASVSSAFEAAGELQKNLGGVALALDNKPLADAIISGGEKLQNLGQSLGSAPEDTKNWKDTIDLVNKADGVLEKGAVLAGRFMDGTSGLSRQFGLELRQELPALFLGGGSLKATMLASGLIDTADTGGAAVVEAYDEAIKKGATHQEGLSAGRKAGAAAAATEAAIQLTLGKLADVAAGKLDNILSKGTAKVAGEGVVEGSQEAGASAAVDLALGNAIDVNKALTQGVLGAAVGKGTAATTSPVDAATSTTVADAATTNANVVTTNIANNIDAAIKSGDSQNVSIAITDSVSSSLNSGASTSVVVDSTVSSAITGGADPAVVIDNTITSAVDSGASVDLTIGAAVSSAVNAGADVNTVVQAATNAATATGNSVNIAFDANMVTISNATTNANTTVNTATGVTTMVDNNTNTTTVVDGNTTTVVDANTNTTSQTKVDGNTQTTVTSDANTNTNTQTVVDASTNTTTSVTVDANNNTTTQTTINADTQTTVLTDPNTNTQTTVVIDTNTGEVIDVKEGDIPPDWTQPVIETPSVPGVPPKVTPDVEEDPAKKEARLRLPQRGGAAGVGGAGLPSTIDISGEALRSRVTQGQIDPLARVKEAQAELEKEVMMNQIDPRLLSVMQQRMGIDQPNPQQQFDSDIGALAKMLRGDSAGPANEKQYYSYGSEDSIDDILGGKAANYAAGGYVEPLKASGGSMALPLLVKSGGALDKYNGREDFKGGKHVAGKGDGQSDDIPAWLADGEFVFPADVVSALGNGSTKAGTDKLYEMMHNIRSRARSKGPKDLPPPAFKSPLDYLKSSKRSTK